MEEEFQCYMACMHAKCRACGTIVPCALATNPKVLTDWLKNCIITILLVQAHKHVTQQPQQWFSSQQGRLSKACGLPKRQPMPALIMFRQPHWCCRLALSTGSK